jgi:outer membrane protein
MVIAKSQFHRTFLAFISLLILNVSVMAKPWAGEDESHWQFSLGLGVGVRTNPVMDNNDIPLLILPQVSYQGDHFFIQNLDFGYSFIQSDTHQFSLLLTPSYDQIFFNEWDISNFIDRSNLANLPTGGPTVEQTNRAIDKRRLHRRRMAALAGLEYNQNLYDLDLQLQVLQEVTGYYDGSEFRFALSKSINLGKHDVKLTLGANWQNAATANYFYGLTTQESLGNFSYDAHGGLSGLLRFDWNYQIDDHWGLRFFTSYRHLSHSISDSPLVTNNNVITAFAGGVYHF